LQIQKVTKKIVRAAQPSFAAQKLFFPARQFLKTPGCTECNIKTLTPDL
jgi:hypothetical protein